MGIYSMNNGVYSSEPMTDIWSPCEQEIRCEGVDINFHEAALMAVAESERVYNNAMKEIGIAELHYLEENGQEMIYEAVDIHGALEKIKKFFVKLIDKVKALFHAFVAKMGSFFSDNKDFATKYKKEFFRKWNDVKSDFEFKGYKFTVRMDTNKSDWSDQISIDEMVKTINSSFNDNNIKNIDTLDKLLAINKNEDNLASLKKFNEYMHDKSDDFNEIFRASANNIYTTAYSSMDSPSTPTSLDASEFSTTLFENFRNGESAKEGLELKKEFSSAQIISDIENSKKVISAAEGTTKTVIKACDKTIKDLERTEKELGKFKSAQTNQSVKDTETNVNSELLNVIVTLNGFVKSASEYATSANGIYMQALKDKCSQDKAIVAKVIAGGKKMQRESYDYYEDNNYTGSYLDTVVIR